MFILNPDSKVNRNIPNMQVAYASAHLKCPVVDQNTMPEPPGRFLKREDHPMAVSVRSLNWTGAKQAKDEYLQRHPGAKVQALTGIMDIQCCYPFLKWDDSLHVDIPFSDKLPFPDYELFDSFPVFSRMWRERRWNFPIMTSLGCPFSCVYCASRNRQVSFRSVDHVIDEIKQARKRWEFSTFEILDDCFNVKRDRLMEFCRKAAPLKLKWFCTNGLRADLFDDEIARALKDSGCQFVSFGIESLDPKILKAIKKGETREQIESAVIAAGKYFDTVNGYFIIGLPGSSFEKDKEALEWAKKTQDKRPLQLFRARRRRPAQRRPVLRRGG